MKKLISSLLLTICFCNHAKAQDFQPVKILEKPRAIWNYEKAGTVCATGTVRVLVEFLASGEIGKIVLVSGLPFGLSDSAIEGARKIKFEPAKRNGVAVNSRKAIEYQFGWNINADFVVNKSNNSQSNEKAETIVQKAIKRLGGERYLAVKTVTGRGNFTAMKENESSVPSAFTDYIVYPDKERTEFKTGGVRTIQTNVGDGGWTADTGARLIKDQTPEQVADFKFSLRTSLDSFLRGSWRNDKDVKLEYVGRREASLGKRNEVVKLTYADGLSVEYEFAAADATPAKVIYKRPNVGGEESVEEDRFAQFVEVNGVFAPYIIDHLRNGKQTSRINYQSIIFNDPLPDALFAKPADVKKLK